jgi:hypothetical protein
VRVNPLKGKPVTAFHKPDKLASFTSLSLSEREKPGEKL